MIRGDAASGHKGHQSGSVAGLRYLGSTLLLDRAIIKCCNTLLVAIQCNCKVFQLLPHCCDTVQKLGLSVQKKLPGIVTQLYLLKRKVILYLVWFVKIIPNFHGY